MRGLRDAVVGLAPHLGRLDHRYPAGRDSDLSIPDIDTRYSGCAYAAWDRGAGAGVLSRAARRIANSKLGSKHPRSLRRVRNHRRVSVGDTTRVGESGQAYFSYASYRVGRRPV